MADGGPGREHESGAFLRQLAAGTAHDLNNLLLVVIGCAELALDDASLTDATRRLMHDILSSSARAAALTRQFLVLGRPPLPAAPIDVAALLVSAESLLRLMVGDGIALHLDACQSRLFVRSGASQIEQVIVNLALNARDAMPHGGRLSVSIAPAPASRIRLTVSDTGTGIDPAVRARMYEPYATTKGDASHSGLGLAVVRTIVEQLQGVIEVTSEPGRGTTFVIDLPAA